MAVWRMIRRVDLPWQSTNKRSLETVMFRNVTGRLKWRFAAQNRPTTLLLQANGRMADDS
jgi:hypothetical protein